MQQTTSPAAAQEQGEQALLQGVTDGTELAGATLVLAYDAQRDGWSADAFHSKVDGRGPALVVALTGERGVGDFRRRRALGAECSMRLCRCPVLGSGGGPPLKVAPDRALTSTHQQRWFAQPNSAAISCPCHLPCSRFSKLTSCLPSSP